MWVKMKPTIVSAVFALILASGLAMGKPLLRPLIGEDLNLTERGWRVITWRWMIYFAIIALVNEALWRGAMHFNPGPSPWISSPEADKIWATSKVTFLIPFTLLYAAWMLPLLSRHRADPSKPMGGGDMFAKTDQTLPTAPSSGSTTRASLG
jgi:intracellular septation protein